MSNSTAQVLMKKGKRGAAAYIHADCASGSPQHLGPLLDVLLNPGKAIDEWETIDWCRWLLAGGRTPDEFAAVVYKYINLQPFTLIMANYYTVIESRKALEAFLFKMADFEKQPKASTSNS
ncbi:unnamed protein product [Euphydryas editha]|uniref:Uncharacterized protein n=1 Tax=Euphydryas editha TaxID=104508 RepID=A0AAU9UCQ5_EUPED|nr:unnamed protein product [Euphydryas editha]